MRKQMVFFTLFSMCLMLMAQTVSAQVNDPNWAWWDDPDLQIDYQYIDVTVRDQIATTRIDMQFTNLSDWWIEGQYLFPLPEGATVSELIMWIDGVPITGEVLEADEASQIYDDFVSQFIDPALLEYAGPNLLQLSVFPIPEFDSRRIEIEYQQILTADNGEITYRFPQNSLYVSKQIDQQRITVNVSSEDAIQTISTTLATGIAQDAPFTATVAYEAADIFPSESFELTYTVADDTIDLDLLSYKPDDEYGYFVVLVDAPNVDVTEDQIIEKDVILVFDTSGSMGGEKITQAKSALLDVVGRLNPGDRFNIVSFNTGTNLYADELVPADNPGNYQAYVNSLSAAGTTNMEDGLLDAIAMADTERLTTILLLTDGRADTSLDSIVRNVSPLVTPNMRLFSFGVGEDADGQLLTSLTTDHRGATTYIASGTDIEQRVSDFYTTISRPALTDLALDFGDAQVEQIYPEPLTDLYIGTQLVVAGRYREGITETFPITLTGNFNGITQTIVYTGNTLTDSGGEAVIPTLWAQQAIDGLLTNITLYGETQEWVDSIISLSQQYNIITPYTSFLIDEDLINDQINGVPTGDPFFPGAPQPTAVTVTQSASYTLSQWQLLTIWFAGLVAISWSGHTRQRI